MTCVARVLALSAQLVATVATVALAGSGAGCSKFGTSSDEPPADAGPATDGPAPDTGAPAQPHRIYVFGGVNTTAGSPLTTASFSTIGPDGELGEFMPAPTLASERTAAAWAQNGKALFAAGGGVPGTALAADGVRTDLADDPASIRGWTMITSLKTARRYPAAAVDATSVYVSGGRNATTALQNIERFDPSTNTWAAAGSLPLAVAAHTTFIRDSQLYVVGGDQLGTPDKLSGAVMRTRFSSDGSAGAWEDVGALKSAVARHAMALVEPWLFVIGGDGGTTTVATVQRGTFSADGLLTWEIDNPLDVPKDQPGLAEACAVVVDRTIYVMGGRDKNLADAKDIVYIGRLDATGKLGWKQSTTRLLEPRAAFGCAVSP